MKLARLLAVLCFFLGSPAIVPAAEKGRTVVIIPIREDIATPVAYLVRRGVKKAMEEKADALVLDMETNGGRLDSTEEIIEALNRFPGLTITYVNRKAFSAGAFIAVATQKNLHGSPKRHRSRQTDHDGIRRRC